LTEVSAGKIKKPHSIIPKTNFAAQQTSRGNWFPKVTSATPELSLGNYLRFYSEL
jgi:hypothetical protein